MHRLSTFVRSVAILGLLAASAGAQEETLYLTNTSVTDSSGVNVTELFLVSIDESTEEAETLLLGVIDLPQVDALACAPDDTVCYLIDKYDPVFHPDGGQFGVYDLLSGTFTLLGEVVDESGELISGIVLAGFSPGPEGELYIASQDTHSVYVLDLASGIASAIGPIVVEGTASVVDLEGADLTFTSSGEMFVWANWANMPDAPSGLYHATLPALPGTIEAVYLGTGSDGLDPESHFFTGVAVRGNGLDDFVGINRFDELHQQASDGSDVALYDVVRDGEPLGHFSGDMHHSFDCYLNIELDRASLAPGEGMTLDMRLVHNRPKTVTVPFTLWIENEAGQVVFQRDSKERTFVWGEDFRRAVSLTIPTSAPSGIYTLHVGLEEMRQGEEVASRTFTVE